MTPLDAATDALAVHRLTRLVTQDTFPPIKAARDAITELFPAEGTMIYDHDEQWDIIGLDYPDRVPVAGDRVAVESKLGLRVEGVAMSTPEGLAAVITRPHPIGELVTCTWCASVWVGFGAVLARAYVPRVWAPVARALAFSSLAGWGTSKLG